MWENFCYNTKRVNINSDLISLGLAFFSFIFYDKMKKYIEILSELDNLCDGLVLN